MSVETVFSFRRGIYPLVIHPDFVTLMEGDHCAATLLYILLSFYAWKLKRRKNGTHRDAAIWIYMSYDDFERELGKRVNGDGEIIQKPLFARDTIAKALKQLIARGFLSKRHNPVNKGDRTLQYFLHIDTVQDAYRSLLEVSDQKKVYRFAETQRGEMTPLLPEKLPIHHRKNVHQSSDFSTMHERNIDDDSSSESDSFPLMIQKISSSSLSNERDDDFSFRQSMSELLNWIKQERQRSPLPPEPPSTLAWGPFKLVWLVQWQNQAWYSDALLLRELKEAEAFFQMPWPDGVPPSYEEAGEIYCFISGWWKSSGRVEIRNLVKNDLAIKNQAQLRKKKEPIPDKDADEAEFWRQASENSLKQWRARKTNAAHPGS